MKIAVILFACNRPKYLRRAIKTHKKVEGLDYIAFIDYSEMQKEIYKIIDEANIYKTIYRLPERFGLNQNIISGINLVLKTYDAVIVLEDDLLLKDDAINWLDEQLRAKDYDKNIFSVSCDKHFKKNKTFGLIYNNINKRADEIGDLIMKYYELPGYYRDGIMFYLKDKELWRKQYWLEHFLLPGEENYPVSKWLAENIFNSNYLYHYQNITRQFRCWAWGIWKDRWDRIDWSLQPKEKNRGSWDMIVNENFKQKDWFCYCSDKPRVKHIGWSGTHYSFLDLFSIRRILRKLFSS